MKRYDHIYISEIVDLILKDKIQKVPSEFDRVSDVFVSFGGSWQRLAEGSIQDLAKLKKVIRYAYDNGHLSKKENW